MILFQVIKMLILRKKGNTNKIGVIYIKLMNLNLKTYILIDLKCKLLYIILEIIYSHNIKVKIKIN